MYHESWSNPSFIDDVVDNMNQAFLIIKLDQDSEVIYVGSG